MDFDPQQSRTELKTLLGSTTIYRLEALERAGLTRLADLPYSIRILLESVLRQVDGRAITRDDVAALAGWQPESASRPDLPFLPARVLMQDFTGVPAIVDLAAMRSALARLGGDPKRINPRIPVDLVIDHSVQVDFFASPEAVKRNAEMEFQRNRERYEFLRWGQTAFDNFRVVPPATGIVHQVNLEFLAQVVIRRQVDGGWVAFPDTLVGTDSHTTMINGLGVLGWGVGGIEAEAAMLGQPLVMVAPEVVGFRIRGRLPEGTTATDLVLTVTQILRRHGVVGKFVEFTGPGIADLSLPDRATIANMSPEYGATVGFFPVDEETLRYMRQTGRPAELIDLVERYTKEQGLFREAGSPEPKFSQLLELNLDDLEASVAGPKRPQDRVPISGLRQSFRDSLVRPVKEGGFELAAEAVDRRAAVGSNGRQTEIGHGSVVIAAITSCTNTSNPMVMVGAGLLAQRAVARGLRVPAFVKTSLAPGSRVVTEYLRRAGLLDPLSDLGFNVVAYGCTTCIGNSGPLPGEVVKAISQEDLVAVAVLSGNRNFEGRINPHVRASYLASPPLVVAYALAGTTDIDLSHEPVGLDPQGQPVYLRELWPSQEDIRKIVESAIRPEMFREQYADVFSGNETWNAIPVADSELYPWDPESTYIQEPPFFADLSPDAPPLADVRRARVLAVVGDSVTTDHISPAGAIPADSPAGRYLIERGVAPREFNSYGSRRGNDRVMTRGTFANIRFKNRLVPGVEGGVTLHFPDGERMSIFEAAMKYRQEGVPLLVLAGAEYGAGSSRDWAAKGASLLGVRAVIAVTFERIHRSNLVGMGILPLQFLPGENSESLGLTGREVYEILDLAQGLRPGGSVRVRAQPDDAPPIEFQARVRVDPPNEVGYYRNGGILHRVVREMVKSSG